MSDIVCKRCCHLLVTSYVIANVLTYGVRFWPLFALLTRSTFKTIVLVLLEQVTIWYSLIQVLNWLAVNLLLEIVSPSFQIVRFWSPSNNNIVLHIWAVSALSVFVWPSPVMELINSACAWYLLLCPFLWKTVCLLLPPYRYIRPSGTLRKF
jgi:hypothetical protein